MINNGNNIQINKLLNGMTLAFDQTSYVDSVIVQLSIPVGSKHENKEINGISHFLEHMAFKGTDKRNYQQIAETIENVGGFMNACTSQETTSYYIKVIKHDIELAFDIISDIIQNSVFDINEINKEKTVILQELSASLDSPQDVIFDMFMAKAMEDTSLAMTILGPADNIKGFNRKHFLDYIHNNYHVNNMVLGVTGNFNVDNVKALSAKYFEPMNLNTNNITNSVPEKYHGGLIIKNKADLEQTQFILGFEGFVNHQDDENYKKYYAMKIASLILGYGMSSRLFQEVREKEGLVYTINTFSESFDKVGLFGIYAGTSVEHLSKLCNTIHNEIDKFITDGIKDDELLRIRKQIVAMLLMENESIGAKNSNMINSILKHKRYISNSEVIEKINSITKQEVADVIAEITGRKKATLAIYGNKINEDDCQILQRHYL